MCEMQRPNNHSAKIPSPNVYPDRSGRATTYLTPETRISIGHIRPTDKIQRTFLPNSPITPPKRGVRVATIVPIFPSNANAGLASSCIRTPGTTQLSHSQGPSWRNQPAVAIDWKGCTCLLAIDCAAARLTTAPSWGGAHAGGRRSIQLAGQTMPPISSPNRPGFRRPTQRQNRRPGANPFSDLRRGTRPRTP